MQVAALEIQGVDEDVTGITQVGDGGGEEASGGENGVIIPAFGAGKLPEFEDPWIDGKVIEIAVLCE